MQIITESQNLPEKIMVYGVEGIGKSTLARDGTPNPIFMDTEGRLNSVNPNRVRIQTWTDAIDMLYELMSVSHQYNTLVIDSLDWLERLLIKDICEKHGLESIEKYEGGYGKGYNYLAEKFEKEFIEKLDTLMTQKGYNIVFVAHSKIKSFNDPLNAATYDRYIVACMSQALVNIVKQWCNCVYFMNYLTMVTEDKQKKTRAKGGTIREVYTQHTAAYDAKNSWDDVPTSFEANPDIIKKHMRIVDPEKSDVRAILKEEIAELAKPLGGNKYIVQLLDGRKFDDLTIEEVEQLKTDLLEDNK